MPKIFIIKNLRNNIINAIRNNYKKKCLMLFYEAALVVDETIFDWLFVTQRGQKS